MNYMKQLIAITITLISTVLSFGQNGWNDNEFVIGTGFNGAVYASLALPDNSVVYGGVFTSYNGTNCQGIVKLRSDGTIDPNWIYAGVVNGAQASIGTANVYDLKLQSDGKILVVGSFNQYWGLTAPNMARISSIDGGLDIPFRDVIITNGPNGAIWSADLQSDGKIIIGGDFSNLGGGNVRNGVARFNTNGTIDNTFTFSGTTNATIRKVKTQSDDKILVGGNYTTINGVAKNRITRLNADGTSDATFLGTGANNYVLDIEVQSDNKILLSGDFTDYNGSLANRFIRLNANGTLEGIFNNCNATVRSLTLLNNGSIVLGGQFNLAPTYSAIRIAVLNSDLTYNTTFANPSANNTVFTTSLLADGRIAVGGDFTFFRGLARNRGAVMQYCDGFSIGAASSSPSLCINTALTPITHSITGGSSFTKVLSAVGLPAGVTATVIGSQLVISGTPTLAGPFNYSITLSACQEFTATGTIIVNPNATFSTATNAITTCIGVPLTPFARQTSFSTGIGTATGLPPGITVSYSNEDVLFSGNPSAAGTFNYTIPIIGYCANTNMTGTITVQDDVQITQPLTNYQCAQSPFTPIQIAVSNATSIGTTSGFVGGMNASLSGNTVTINGTNTSIPGTYNYTVQVNGLCGSNNILGTLVIVGTNDLIPSNSMDNPPAVCVGTPIDTIKIATNPIVTTVNVDPNFPFPSGLSFNYTNDTIYIFGTIATPNIYSIQMVANSPCGNDYIFGNVEILSGDITVGPAPFFGTICVNTPLFTSTQPFYGAFLDSVINLPPGITVNHLPFGGLEFSGTPTQSGTFNYTIYTSNNCASEIITGTMTVNPSSVSVSAASATPTVCTGTSITPITHTITGTGTVGTATGLPAGITASNVGNTITISGSSTNPGTYNYTIPVSTSCGSVNATGTITVISQNTVSAEPASVTNCVNNAMTPILRNTGGATGIGTTTGLPVGVTASWNANTLTIDGTPTSAGTFNYTIPLTGGCGNVNATGSFVISPESACTQGLNDEQMLVFSLYPNPAQTSVSFTFEGVTTATIELMDLNGKLIATTLNVQSGDALSIENLENGVYMILIRTEKGNAIQRLIKQ